MEKQLKGKGVYNSNGFDNYSYPIIEEILSKNLDHAEANEDSGHTVEHNSLSGRSYYQQIIYSMRSSLMKVFC